jgi:hypothetical protein
VLFLRIEFYTLHPNSVDYGRTNRIHPERNYLPGRKPGVKRGKPADKQRRICVPGRKDGDGKIEPAENPLWRIIAA